jgi:hypothetical protein
MQDAGTPLKCAVLCYATCWTSKGPPASPTRPQIRIPKPVRREVGRGSPGTTSPVPRESRERPNAPPNETLDRFVVKALERDLPVTLVNHASAPHAFDLFHDSRPREIVRQIWRSAIHLVELMRNLTTTQNNTVEGDDLPLPARSRFPERSTEELSVPASRDLSRVHLPRFSQGERRKVDFARLSPLCRLPFRADEWLRADMGRTRAPSLGLRPVPSTHRMPTSRAPSPDSSSSTPGTIPTSPHPTLATEAAFTHAPTAKRFPFWSIAERAILSTAELSTPAPARPSRSYGTVSEEHVAVHHRDPPPSSPYRGD